jgi:hypothetical protein
MQQRFSRPTTPYILTDLLPDAERFREIIRVFDLPVATDGLYAHVVADSQSQRAVCYLDVGKPDR